MRKQQTHILTNNQGTGWLTVFSDGDVQIFQKPNWLVGAYYKQLNEVRGQTTNLSRRETVLGYRNPSRRRNLQVIIAHTLVLGEPASLSTIPIWSRRKLFHSSGLHTRNALPLLSDRSIGVLKMTVPISIIQIHLGLHSSQRTKRQVLENQSRNTDVGRNGPKDTYFWCIWREH